MICMHTLQVSPSFLGISIFFRHLILISFGQKSIPCWLGRAKKIGATTSVRRIIIMKSTVEI